MVTTNFPRSRNRAPDDTAWASIRDEFTQLYLHKRLSLKEISVTLAETHDFHAEPHMFKHRIKQWNLRKNFKLEELGAVAKAVEPFIQAGLQAPTAILDSREVPLTRAKRHFKDSFQTCASRKKCRPKRTAPDNVVPRNPTVKASSHEYTQNKRQCRPVQIPRVFLQHSPEMQSLESTLIQVNNYYAWRIIHPTDHFLYHMGEFGCHLDITELLDPTEVFYLMDDGMRAFNDGAVQIAQDLLKQFCARAKVLLLQQHPELIETLIYYGVNATNTFLPSAHLQTSIFRFLFDLACKFLGGSHPILMIIDLLQHPGALQKSWPLLAFKILREVVSRQGGSSESAFELDIAMFDVTLQQSDFQLALQFGQNMLQQYVDELGAGHLHCRRLLKSLGYLHYHYDQNDEAEKLCFQVLDLDPSYKENADNAEAVSINAMEILGWVFEGRKNFSEAGKWYHQATAAAINGWGSDDSATQVYRLQWNVMQARLDPQRVVSSFSQSTDDINLLEDLQQEISRLGIEDVTKYETFSQNKPWDTWAPNTVCGSSSKNLTSTTDTRELQSPPDGEGSTREEQSPLSTAPDRTAKEVSHTILMTPALHNWEPAAEGDPSLSMTTPFSLSETWTASTEAIATEDFSTMPFSNSVDVAGDDTFIDTLPILGDGIDFEFMFSYLGGSEDTRSNGFFSCTDFQDWWALEGQDYGKDVRMSE